MAISNEELLNAVYTKCDILNKEESTRNYISLSLNRTNEMFEWKGLPDTIDPEILELYLQVYGQVGFCVINDSLYALHGNAGGALDPYNRSTLFIVANQALHQNGEFQFRIANHLPPFNTDNWRDKPPCVLMKNDLHATGLLYMIRRYATQLAENDVSIRSAQINSRIFLTLVASTDNEKKSADMYVAAVEAGKLSIITDESFVTGTGVRPTAASPSSANYIIQLLELQQYLKAALFNDIGLNANFNMKREYLSEEELQANEDILLPLCDNMLRFRRKALEHINKLFGTNITVDKGSAWKNKQEEIDVAKELHKNEAKIGGGNNET